MIKALKKIISRTHKYTLVFIPVFLLALSGKGQDLLSVEDVIRITLENNFDVEIAKNMEAVFLVIMDKYTYVYKFSIKDDKK